MNHEKENKKIHYSVNLLNKESKALLSFFLSFFFFLISDFYRKSHHLITKPNSTHLPENEKTFLYIKLHQARRLYFPFLFPSSVL